VTFLRRALERNEHFEISLIDFSGRIRGDEAIPQTINDLTEYDGIFLVDFPISRTYSRLFSSYLESGGSIYHVLGQSSTFDRDFIPVSLFSSTPTRWATDKFNPQLTVRGGNHPIMNFGDENWTSEMPPLSGFLIADKLRKGVDILLEHPKLPGLPILAVYHSGKNRQVILNGGDFWRWAFTPFGFASDDQIWQDMILSSTDWILSREEITPFTVRTDKKVYKSGESVFVTSTLRNESGEPVDGRMIELTIKSKDQEFTRVMQESGGGFYTLEIGAMDVGEYSVVGEVEDKAGLPVSKKTTSFAVESYSAEYADIRENKALLEGIAAMSGGEYLEESRLTQRLSSLELPNINKKVRAEWDLRHRWWLLLIIVLLLSLEWIIRKRSNLP